MKRKKVKKLKKEKKINRWLYWTPRILSIVFILFLAIFSLDVFEESLGFWGTILGLFMHNIPSMILLVVLIISWKHELVGAIAFVLAGLLYTGISIVRVIMSSPTEWYMLAWSLQIAGPAFLIGILFFMNWTKKRQKA